jgi:hypothetical protein
MKKKQINPQNEKGRRGRGGKTKSYKKKIIMKKEIVKEIFLFPPVPSVLFENYLQNGLRKYTSIRKQQQQ